MRSAVVHPAHHPSGVASLSSVASDPCALHRSRRHPQSPRAPWGLTLSRCTLPLPAHRCSTRALWLPALMLGNASLRHLAPPRTPWRRALALCAAALCMSPPTRSLSSGSLWRQALASCLPRARCPRCPPRSPPPVLFTPLAPPTPPCFPCPPCPPCPLCPPLPPCPPCPPYPRTLPALPTLTSGDS